MLSHAHQHLAHTLSYNALKNPNAMSLPSFATHLEEIEAMENPDTIIDLAQLRMSEAMNIVVPGQGEFALSPYSQRQLGNLTGIRFDRWFENSSTAIKVMDMNNRFARATGLVKIRTYRASDTGTQAAGVLRAFVSPSYQPISDAYVAHLILSALRRTEDEFPVMKAEITDTGTVYSIRIGQSFNLAVGEIFGTLQIINSGTGASSLRISLALLRKVCSNGLCLPLGGNDANLLTRRHQGQVELQLWEKISTRLVGIGEKLARGVKTLDESRNILVTDPQQEIENILRRAHLPKRLLEPLTKAFQKEPHFSAFGISQAITDAQTHQDLRLSLEDRLHLEDSAGAYLNSVANPTM
ncbi:MAG: DUF932 domain-containing protein [Candidatus Riflebacteria bacterium]|nr:DUF932 domain-containing protein [Candidatus Riflebacteria bacterium]